MCLYHPNICINLKNKISIRGKYFSDYEVDVPYYTNAIIPKKYAYHKNKASKLKTYFLRPFLKIYRYILRWVSLLAKDVHIRTSAVT